MSWFATGASASSIQTEEATFAARLKLEDNRTRPTPGKCRARLRCSASDRFLRDLLKRGAVASERLGRFKAAYPRSYGPSVFKTMTVPTLTYRRPLSLTLIGASQFALPSRKV